MDTLEQVLKRDRKIDFLIKYGWCKDFALAVDYIHLNKITHKKIYPKYEN